MVNQEASPLDQGFHYFRGWRQNDAVYVERTYEDFPYGEHQDHDRGRCVEPVKGIAFLVMHGQPRCCGEDGGHTG